MSDNAKLALLNWLQENSRRRFGGTFYLPKLRAVSVPGGMWVLQEFHSATTDEGVVLTKGRNRVKKGKGARPHFDPWATVSLPMTKDAAGARLAALI